MPLQVSLIELIQAKPPATVYSCRQLDESDCCNSDTGLAWWKMCSSTWLHHAGQPCSVWARYSGSCGADTATSRSSDDIRARPLYADNAGNATEVTEDFDVNKNEVSGLIGLQGLTSTLLNRQVVFSLNATTVSAAVRRAAI